MVSITEETLTSQLEHRQKYKTAHGLAYQIIGG